MCLARRANEREGAIVALHQSDRAGHGIRRAGNDGAFAFLLFPGGGRYACVQRGGLCAQLAGGASAGIGHLTAVHRWRNALLDRAEGLNGLGYDVDLATLPTIMTALHVTIETRLAHITRTGPVLIETHFKSDVTIDPEGLMDNIIARREMCKGVPHVMLTVIPGEPEMSPAVMRTDLYHLPEDRAVVKAIALVLEGDLLPRVFQMYFSFFPQTFRTEVFSTEQAARDWLADQAKDLDKPTEG